MAIIRHDDGRTVQLTGDDLAEYVSARFPRKPEPAPVEMTDNARRKTGMNQERMNPATGLVFRPVGRDVKVGNWRLVDVRYGDRDERRIYHYGTLMGAFVQVHGVDTWEFVPVSTGWGSVSDQNGMNRILWRTGWNYRRNGGRPRYEYNGVEMFPVSQETEV